MRGVLILFFIILGSVCHAELRTWTAVNGKEVEAEFVSNEKGIVKLKLKTGKVFEVPLSKLSKEDNEFISSLAKPDGVTKKELEEPSDTPKSLSDADVEGFLKEAVGEESLQYRDGLFYQNNEPYSGWAKGMYDSGQAKGLGQFKDGKQDGLEMRWHENGQKSYEATYKDGEQDGLRTRWHENGQKKAEINFKNGKPVEGSEKYWNSKGERVDSIEEAKAE